MAAKRQNEAQLKLADLLVTLQDKPGYSTVQSQLSGVTRHNKVLPALPQVQKDRFEREVTYKRINKEVSDKWADTIKINSRTDSLTFPLEKPQLDRISTNSLTNKFRPVTSLENSVATILRESGVEEKKIQEYEELKRTQLDANEIAKRDAEIRRMRGLVFYHELKMKRRAKIKSKSYRKLIRREKAKREQREREFIETHGDEDDKLQLQIAAEKKLALERATQRHRSKGTWAKNLTKRKHVDTATKQALSRQAELHRQLLRKQRSLGEEDSDDEIVNDTEAEGRIDQIVAGSGATEGLLGMKFMKEGLARKKKAYEEALAEDDFDAQERSEAAKKRTAALQKAEFSVVAKPTITGQNSADKFVGSTMLLQHTALATGHKTRMSGTLGVDITSLDGAGDENTVLGGLFGKPNFPEEEAEGEIFDVNQNFPQISPATHAKVTKAKKSSETQSAEPKQMRASAVKPLTERPQPKTNQKESNPWLTAKSGAKVMAGKAAPEIDAESFSATNVLELQVLKDNGGKEELQAQRKQTPSKKRKRKRQSGTTPKNEKVLVEADTIKPKVSLQLKDKDDDKFDLLAFADKRQRALIRRAFADDNVMDEFEAEKTAVAQEESGINTTADDSPAVVPGWGNWVGTGVKRPRKRRKKNTDGEKKIPRVQKPRRDAKRRHVIISEKKDQKAQKFLVSEVPYPFTSKRQYELSLLQPIGKEWNTSATYSRAITPRIKTRSGIVIPPISKPKQKKKQKQISQKNTKRK
eukprot:TRINITY_DN7728_c0_g2_i1.p1 TRINITY_DN7728_c0_g2~~TRINITY_DN7728_c0_g2_i1.p1  ORF type:complete len:881 (+),score=258.03 TRINITY_DN7728_c0_g2_i1:384-2645(+)